MNYEHASDLRIDSFWLALDQVARERQYLGFLQAPEIESTRNFIHEIISNNWTQILAIDSDRVIGWCDIIPHSRDHEKHVGTLGMGIIDGYRSQGIGTELIKRSLTDALQKGIHRVELQVVAGNQRAIGLYQKVGFQREGQRRDARYVDGVYEDMIFMSLLRSESEQLHRENVGQAAASHA